MKQAIKHHRLFTLKAVILLCTMVSGCRSISEQAEVQLKRLTGRRATLYRLEPIPTKDRGVLRMYGYDLLDGPIPMNHQDSLDALKLIFKKGAISQTPREHLAVCGFEPCMMLRYGDTDILISLSCDKMEIKKNGKRLFGYLDIRPNHNSLIELARKLFPEDTYIQLLQPD